MLVTTGLSSVPTPVTSVLLLWLNVLTLVGLVLTMSASRLTRKSVGLCDRYYRSGLFTVN